MKRFFAAIKFVPFAPQWRYGLSAAILARATVMGRQVVAICLTGFPPDQSKRDTRFHHLTGICDTDKTRTTEEAEALTESEGKTILRFGSLDALRDRILAARNESGPNLYSRFNRPREALAESSSDPLSQSPAQAGFSVSTLKQSLLSSRGRTVKKMLVDGK